MFLSGDSEFGKSCNLCLYLGFGKGVVRKDFGVKGCLEFLFDLLRDMRLFFTVGKDPTRVLKASVVALTIFQGRVVKAEKEADEFFKVLSRIVQFYIQNFDVTRTASADLAVSRVLDAWVGQRTLNPTLVLWALIAPGNFF